jgi:hypothetical protein
MMLPDQISRTVGRAGRLGSLCLILSKAPSIMGSSLRITKYRGAHTTLLCNRSKQWLGGANQPFYSVGASIRLPKKLFEASVGSSHQRYNPPRSITYDLGVGHVSRRAARTLQQGTR